MKQTPKQRRRSAQRIKVRKHFSILSKKAVRYKGLIWQLRNSKPTDFVEINDKVDISGIHELFNNL